MRSTPVAEREVSSLPRGCCHRPRGTSTRSAYCGGIGWILVLEITGCGWLANGATPTRSCVNFLKTTSPPHSYSSRQYGERRDCLHDEPELMVMIRTLVEIVSPYAAGVVTERE